MARYLTAFSSEWLQALLKRPILHVDSINHGCIIGAETDWLRWMCYGPIALLDAAFLNLQCLFSLCKQTRGFERLTWDNDVAVSFRLSVDLLPAYGWTMSICLWLAREEIVPDDTLCRAFIHQWLTSSHEICTFSFCLDLSHRLIHQTYPLVWLVQALIGLGSFWNVKIRQLNFCPHLLCQYSFIH